jgi:hypothetical protein
MFLIDAAGSTDAAGLVSVGTFVSTAWLLHPVMETMVVSVAIAISLFINGFIVNTFKCFDKHDDVFDVQDVQKVVFWRKEQSDLTQITT